MDFQIQEWRNLRLFLDFAGKRWPPRDTSSLVAANFSLRAASVGCIRFTQAEACGYNN